MRTPNWVNYSNIKAQRKAGNKMFMVDGLTYYANKAKEKRQKESEVKYKYDR